MFKENILKLFEKVNKESLNASIGFYLFPPDSGFVTEEAIDTISGQKEIDSETKIIFWLWRIQRYFMVNEETKGINSKEKTIEKLEECLSDLPSYPQDIQKYLCTNTHALNCLLFNLLVCNKQAQWDAVRSVIEQHNTDQSQILLLNWCYSFYFDKEHMSCSNVIQKLTVNDTNELQLPNILLSRFFAQIALGEWYSNNPRSNPDMPLRAILPTEELDPMIMLPRVVVKGICFELFTNKNVKLNELTFGVLRHFLVRFRPSEIKSLPYFNPKQFSCYVDHLLQFSFKHQDQFNQLDFVIGMSQLHQFYSPKSISFLISTHGKALRLVHQLFEEKEYLEAYELYDDVTTLTFSSENQKEILAKKAIYCFLARIDQWLKGTEEKPKFNELELDLISGVKTQEKREVPKKHLFDLAKRLGAHFKDTENERIQNLCKEYYSQIIKFLSNPQKKEVNNLFKKPQKVVPLDPKKNTSDLDNSPKSSQQVKEPAKPKVKEPAKPKMIEPAKHKVKEPAKPKVIEPAKHKVIEPAKPKVKESAKPKVIEPAKHKVKEPAKPKVIEPAKPKVKEPAKPKVIEPAKPKVKEPAKPKVKEPAKPKVKEPAKPKVQEPVKPEIKEPVKTAQQQKTLIVKKRGVPIILDDPTSDTVLKVVSSAVNKAIARGVTSRKSWQKPDKADSSPLDPKIWPKPKASANQPPKRHHFFATKPDLDKPNQQVILRSRLPFALVSLLDELRRQIKGAHFYLTGAAPSNILDGVKPNDYDILVINTTLQELMDLLKAKGFKPEIRSKKHPIIYCEVAEGVFLDFSVKPLDALENIERILEDDFKVRDFNVNALYCKLSPKERYSVFSFSDALATKNINNIAAIQNPAISFRQDPTRLIRLVKVLISHPTYQTDLILAKALKDLEGKWLDLFKQFLPKNHGNRFRVDHAFKKLFARHRYEQINTMLDQIGALSELTGHSLEEVNKACTKIPAVNNPEQKFLYWILANTLQATQSGATDSLCPISEYIVLSPIENDIMSFIKDKAKGNVPFVHIFIQDILTLVKAFESQPEISAGTQCSI